MAESDRSASLFTNTLYDKLKFVALILLPALATLYIVLDGIWEIGYSAQVVGTITAIDTFLGAVLKISNNRYYKNEKNFDGEINFIQLDEDEEEKVQFAINRDPVEVIHDEPGKHSFEFKVNKLRGGIPDEH